MPAKVNLRTGKIIGAKKGSFAWWHEKGHLIYDDSDEGINDGVKQNYSMYCLLIFLVLGQFIFLFKILSIMGVIMLLYYFFKEEFWCNMYAEKQMRKKKK